MHSDLDYPLLKSAFNLIVSIADLKSMVSAGLASLSCNYDLEGSAYGKNTMKVLCIGHGGGSLPLFLASKIPGQIYKLKY